MAIALDGRHLPSRGVCSGHGRGKSIMRFRGKISAGGACLALLASSPAFADGLTANGQFTTNYVLRGISQTATRPAVQGGLDYDTGVGLTIGTWVSSLDFGDDTNLE